MNFIWRWARCPDSSLPRVWAPSSSTLNVGVGYVIAFVIGDIRTQQFVVAARLFKLLKNQFLELLKLLIGISCLLAHGLGWIS